MGAEAVQPAVRPAVEPALVPTRDPGTLAELRRRLTPTTLARSRTLPVDSALGVLLPGGALVRGTVVEVGSTSLAFALIGAATRAGSWVAAIGATSLGWVAAAEHGVVLERAIVVPEVPLDRWSTVVAALLDGVDLLLLAERSPLAEREVRPLLARLRERGAVVVLLPGTRRWWPSTADVCLRTQATWSGVDRGHGRLGSRRLIVTVDGRRSASGLRRVDLALP